MTDDLLKVIKAAGEARDTTSLKEAFAFMYAAGSGETAILESASCGHLETVVKVISPVLKSEKAARRLAVSAAAIITTGKILAGLRSALLAEAEAKKSSLRQSTEVMLVTFQADFESAESLLLEVLVENLGGNSSAGAAERATALLYKNAVYLLQVFPGVINSLAIEEPVIIGVERVLAHTGNFARMSKVLRDLCGSDSVGKEATEDIMASLGILPG